VLTMIAILGPGRVSIDHRVAAKLDEGPSKAGAGAA